MVWQKNKVVARWEHKYIGYKQRVYPHPSLYHCLHIDRRGVFWVRNHLFCCWVGAESWSSCWSSVSSNSPVAVFFIRVRMYSRFYSNCTIDTYKSFSIHCTSNLRTIMAPYIYNNYICYTMVANIHCTCIQSLPWGKIRVPVTYPICQSHAGASHILTYERNA